MSETEDLKDEEINEPDEDIDIILNIPAEKLHPFKDHPYKVLQDESMDELVESIRQYGVLTPLVARPRDDGEFEIVSGHRRHYAAMLAGEEDLPVIVREMNDDEAVIWMVDANFQRENVLPSERAFAYKMKNEALKHQGIRTDLTSSQLETKLESKGSTDIIASEEGISRAQVQRYIRLTNLVPEMLDMVDDKKISFSAAVELSYLKPNEQSAFLEACDYAQAMPSLSQAQRIRQMSQDGTFSLKSACEIMSETKKGDVDRVSFKTEQLRKYFPKSYTVDQMQVQIIKLLDQWQRKRKRNQER